MLETQTVSWALEPKRPRNGRFNSETALRRFGSEARSGHLDPEVVLIKMPVGALESPMVVFKAPLTSELGPNGVGKKRNSRTTVAKIEN